jgi:hypothetical protein
LKRRVSRDRRTIERRRPAFSIRPSVKARRLIPGNRIVVVGYCADRGSLFVHFSGFSKHRENVIRRRPARTCFFELELPRPNDSGARRPGFLSTVERRPFELDVFKSFIDPMEITGPTHWIAIRKAIETTSERTPTESGKPT